MTAVLNADDPMVAALGDGLPRVIYAGLDDKSLLQSELSHGADAKFCPRCGSPFIFEGVYFGHVGHYRCPRGDFARPAPDVRATSVSIDGMDGMRLRVTDGAQTADVEVPLSGLYNAYNVVLALAAAKALNVPLAKSAAFLIALNDRIADGQDVSWIWDVDFEQLKGAAKHIVVSGDRALDLRVRLKYAELPHDQIEVVTNWRDALRHAAEATPPGETLFILPTYTAMLELRSVLTQDGALHPYWQGRPPHAKP